MAPASLSFGFQSFTPIPTIELGPSGTGSRVGGLVHALGPYESLQQTPLWGWEFLLLPSQPQQVFADRGLRLYFPALRPWVARSALLPSCASRFIHRWMWDRLVLQPPPCPSPLHPLPISAPPTDLVECFFFNSLIVGLPYSLIFQQFWLLFLFKFVVVLLVVRSGTVSTYTSILAGSQHYLSYAW